MKPIILLAILLISYFNVNAQGIGELAPDKEPMDFPDNTIGLDIMFSDGGFGLGGFYRREISKKVTLFGDISVSEAKDEKEFEYVDYYGQKYTVGKKNRIFIVPLNFGVHYRLFENSITDNLRPYINAGVGPTLVVTTPYSEEYFKAFADGQLHYALGSYIGFGANIGIDTRNLMGLNFRYYFITFFDEGVESLEGRFKKNLGGFFVTINLGLMY
jgi:hypothetical protein